MNKTGLDERIYLEKDLILLRQSVMLHLHKFLEDASMKLQGKAVYFSDSQRGIRAGIARELGRSTTTIRLDGDGSTL
ncbi:MAG: hypothetical protein ACKVKF_01520 [Rhodobacterales bacterium]|nr:hypothetical protein [Puniceibacterium antarcticum]